MKSITVINFIFFTLEMSLGIEFSEISSDKWNSCYKKLHETVKYKTVSKTNVVKLSIVKELRKRLFAYNYNIGWYSKVTKIILTLHLLIF